MKAKLTAISAGLAALAGEGAAAQVCTAGNESCPVVLHMARGAALVTGTGIVSGTHPDFHFKFGARAASG
jgi:hypothetical protein